jgi:hypothetical protein
MATAMFAETLESRQKSHVYYVDCVPSFDMVFLQLQSQSFGKHCSCHLYGESLRGWGLESPCKDLAVGDD